MVRSERTSSVIAAVSKRRTAATTRGPKSLTTAAGKSLWPTRSSPRVDRLLAGAPQALTHPLLLAVGSVVGVIVALQRVATGAEPGCERDRHIVAGRDLQQLSERRREPDRGDRHPDLNRAGVAVDDPDRAETVENVDHLVVAGQDQRGEGRDRLLARPRADHLE